MSDLFDEMGCIAIVVFVLLVVGALLLAIFSGILDFILKYYWVLAIILGLIALGLSYYLFSLQRNSTSKSTAAILFYCVMSFFAFVQNGVFLVYGLYRSLTVHPESAFLSLLGVGGFVIFYAVNAIITFAATFIPYEKSWGAALPLLTAILGTMLCLSW